MEYIKYRFYQKANKCAKEFQRLKKEHADVVLGEVTLGQVLTGMKGIPLMVTDTSKLDPEERRRALEAPLRTALAKVSHYKGVAAEHRVINKLYSNPRAGSEPN